MAASYVLGMFPTAQLIGYITRHDPTEEGSRNPGASNMFRIAGWLPGIIVLLVDVAKGAVPAVAAWILVDRQLALICGAAAILGHMFPAARGFKGGKGVACFGGLTFILSPVTAIICLSIWLITLKLWHKASLSSLITVPLVLVGQIIENQIVGSRDSTEIIVMAALVALICVKHTSNIQRLLQRRESKIT